jgi:hypothetical protein
MSFGFAKRTLNTRKTLASSISIRILDKLLQPGSSLSPKGAMLTTNLDLQPISSFAARALVRPSMHASATPTFATHLSIIPNYQAPLLIIIGGRDSSSTV